MFTGLLYQLSGDHTSLLMWQVLWPLLAILLKIIFTIDLEERSFSISHILVTFAQYSAYKLTVTSSNKLDESNCTHPCGVW